MTDDALIEAYAECLRALETGATPAEALARYPTLADELRPLLEVAVTLQTLGVARPAPRSGEMAARARLLTLATGQLRRIGPGRGAAGQSRWVRLVLSALALLVIVFGGSYSAVTASAQSLPGDTFYGLKRSIENVQLWFASDVQQRSELEMEFEERRLEEVHTLTGRQQTAAVEFKGIITELGETEWVVNTIRVVVTSTTQLSGTPQLGARAEVHGTLWADGTVLAAEISLEARDGEEAEDDTTSAGQPPPARTATRPALPTATLRRSATATPTEVVVQPTPSAPPPTATLAPSPLPSTATPGPAATATTVKAPTAAPTSTDEAEEVEFEGVIESIAPDIWRISGQDVLITAETRIHGASPAVGKRVEVHALRQADGRLAAREIDVKDDSDDDDHPNPPAETQPRDAEACRPSMTACPRTLETASPSATIWARRSP